MLDIKRIYYERVRPFLFGDALNAMDRAIKRVLGALAALVLLSAPQTASAALEREFYTWGGHDAVVSAFQRSALIFGANDYKSLFSVLVVASLATLIIRIVGGVAFGSKDIHGQNYATGALIPWLLTIAIFSASVIPKGTLHIYDPTENKYQAVGGIPDIIVLFAGVTNSVERAFVELVSTSGDPVGFQEQAGGKGFLGLYNITSKPLQAADGSLDASLRNYVTDCVYFEAALNSTYAEDLRKTSTDLITSLAKAVNPAVGTVMYGAGLAPNGSPMSCTDAWANLQPRLTAPDALNNNLIGICTEMGFDGSTAGGLNDCKDRLGGPVTAQIATGKTSMEFLRTAYVARVFDSVLSSDSAGEGLANYSILNKASATMTTVNGWLPTIRAVILAVTVALTPFLSLLMLTPLMPRATKFVLGSFAFLTIWGTVDAILHQFIVDYANRTYAEIRQYNLGLDAVRFFPSSTEKILSMFGLVRASGLALAATIASSVIGLGASVGAAVGGKLMADATGTGAAAAGQSLDAGQKAQARRSNQMAIPTETLANEHAWNTRQLAEHGQQAGQLQNQLGRISAAGGLPQYTQQQHDHGFTASYKEGGEVGLNKQFMAKASEMGVSTADAKALAAGNINNAAALAQLMRMDTQGIRGDQVAETWRSGAAADLMQNSAVGQSGGWTLYKPAEGVDMAKKGMLSFAWDGGQIIGNSGSAVSARIAASDQQRFDKTLSNSISQAVTASQSLASTWTHSIGNSSTYSNMTTASQQLVESTGGSVDIMRATTATAVSSFRDSQIIDERTGQTVDKAAFASATAGVGTPQISPVKANIEGGASWRVTTNDGKSYTVHQTAEQAQSTQRQIGETYRDTTSAVRSGSYGTTAQRALAQFEQVSGTTQAATNASLAYTRATAMSESRGEAHSRASERAADMYRVVVRGLGEDQFGGGMQGDMRAAEYLEKLNSEGRWEDIERITAEQLSKKGITKEALGADLKVVQGPDETKAPELETIREKIESGRGELKARVEQPQGGVSDPTSTVKNRLDTPVGMLEAGKIRQDLKRTEREIQAGGGMVEKRGGDLKRETSGPLAAPILAAKGSAGFVTADMAGGGQKIKHAATTAADLIQNKAPDLPAGRK